MNSRDTISGGHAMFGKRALAILTVTIIAAALVIISVPSASQEVFKRYTVKLYSGDKVVATWVAITPGRVEGETFAFTAGSDLSPQHVRISGTYSVEQIK